MNDVKIFFLSLFFSIKYSRNNKFSDLLLFRNAIEIDQISPFRNIFTGFKMPKFVRLTLPHFGNVRIDFDLSDNFQMAICEEFVKHKIYNLEPLNFIPDISIDCGSYRGYFTFLINNRFSNCKKICIEPHPENNRILNKTIEENDIRSIETFNKALSKSPDKVVLELWGSNMGLSNDQSGHLNLVEIETMSLFKLLAEIDVAKKLILKVDIEGSELDFFPDCIISLPKCCAVYLETHDGWNSLYSIQSRFEEYGFQFLIVRERDLCIDSFAIRTGIDAQ